MDPNATLERLRQLAVQVLNPDHQDALGDEIAEEMAELVRVLDDWMSAGGFLPAAWRQGRP
jgi:flagellin-like hook-associated protein FlgL